MSRRVAVNSKRSKRTRATPVEQQIEVLSEEAPLRRKVMIAGVAGALLLFIATYLWRLDHVIGMYGDDSWYVVLAKSLATGQGYSLVNSPSPGILPIYPPVFPWLLSLAYRLSPEFPQNLWLLKSVSIAAMLGIGVAVYAHLRSERKLSVWFAIGIAMATVVNPAFVFMATSTVMAECVFTLGMLLTIVVIERGARVARGRGYWLFALGGALASFTFLTRAQGAGLIIAVAVYLLKERMIRALALFVVIAALLAGSWTLYAWKRAPTPEQRDEQNSYIVKSYAAQLTSSAQPDPAVRPPFLNRMATRSFNNSSRMLESNIGSLIVYPVFRTAEPLVADKRTVRTALLSLLLSVIIIIGFISALRARVTLADLAVFFSTLILMVWTFASFRFVLPLLPFAIFYLVLGLRAICRLTQRLFSAPGARLQRAALLGVIALIIGFNTYTNAAYGLSMRGPESERPEWLRAFEENRAMIQWAGEHIPKESVISSSNPGLVHLYTGHKTVGTTDPSTHWELWKRIGVRYAVLNSIRPQSDPSPAMKRYSIIYTSDRMKLRIVDYGEAAKRLPWPNNP
ncbi:MAG: ArnT family glycosyltransferase [Blastocatellales bacterium]